MPQNPQYPQYPQYPQQGYQQPRPQYPAQQGYQQPRPQQAPQQQAYQQPRRQLSIPEQDMEWARATIKAIRTSYDEKVIGQPNLRTTLLVSLLADGHVLLESVPGLAKTTAAKALADAVSGSFSRIQCTPDLLPSDIVGTQIYNASENKFETRKGPVFANFVLLDEVNRSSAKTQAAMLEAMQERQVTIGEETHELSSDMFIVVATQNPVEQEGTYSLSEAQEDRFLCKEILGYPKVAEEIEILNRIESGAMSRRTNPVASVQDVKRLKEITRQVFVQDNIKRYIAELVDATRHPAERLPKELAHYVKMGASPRASISLMQAAKALALLNGKDHVVTENVRDLCRPIMRHRIALNYSAVADGVNVDTIIDAFVGCVKTP